LRWRPEGWLIDMGDSEMGWTVRLRKNGAQQAIETGLHLHSCIVGAIIAARISDLSA